MAAASDTARQIAGYDSCGALQQIARVVWFGAAEANRYEAGREGGLESLAQGDLPLARGIGRGVGFHVRDARWDGDVHVRGRGWDDADALDFGKAEARGDSGV